VRKYLKGFAIASLLTALSVVPAATSEAADIDVSGKVKHSKEVKRFEGVLSLTNFVLQDGEVIAEGLLNGVFTDKKGNIVDTIEDVVTSVAVDLKHSKATCDILHLELGPLDLDLLGLIVHLDKIVLDIDADPTGGLLGDLLCSIAGLLDDLDLASLVDALNDLLTIIG
jgi:hypothetical protein